MFWWQYFPSDLLLENIHHLKRSGRVLHVYMYKCQYWDTVLQTWVGFQKKIVNFWITNLHIIAGFLQLWYILMDCFKLPISKEF